MSVRIGVEIVPDRQAVVVGIAGTLGPEADEPLRALVRRLVDSPVEVLVIDLSRARFAGRQEHELAELLVASSDGRRVVFCNAPRRLPSSPGGSSSTASLHWHVRRGSSEHWADVVRRATVPGGCRCCSGSRRRRARTSCGCGGRECPGVE